LGREGCIHGAASPDLWAGNSLQSLIYNYSIAEKVGSGKKIACASAFHILDANRYFQSGKPWILDDILPIFR
jgi:hypothetical protein